ncbi:hypothetical protein QEN19_001046 [Hanseniaspora menglaensis]
MYKMSPQDFIFLQKIGSGSYSEVYKAKYKQSSIENYQKTSSSPENKFFAIKICSKKHIIREQKEKYVNVEKTTLLELASEINHPGIVNLYYTFHDEFNLYFVLDYIPCGELFNYLYSSLNKGKVKDNKVVLKFVSQLIDTLYYLKRHLIVHRDLKPENLLLDNRGCVMITDFGVAVALTSNDARSGSFVGTADYVSPELLLTNSCSFKSDIWSLGCIFYQLKEGRPPFRGADELATFENIVSGKCKKLITSTIDETNYADMVNGMLCVDENKRLDLEDIMKHPFCKSINWENKNEIWAGIWEGSSPIDTFKEYYLKEQKTILQQRSDISMVPTPTSPVKSGQPLNKTKGIGYPKKKKPVTTQNIVQWRKQLGLNAPYGQQTSMQQVINTPVSARSKGISGFDASNGSNGVTNVNGNNYVGFKSQANISSQTAAQIVLKKQMIKAGKNGLVRGQFYQQSQMQLPLQQQQLLNRPSGSLQQQTSNQQSLKPEILRSSKEETLRANSNLNRKALHLNTNGVLRKESGVKFYKIPYVEKNVSVINLNYHSVKPTISTTEENCNKFLEFMKHFSSKIVDILDEMKDFDYTLQLMDTGEIRMTGKNNNFNILLGDLSDDHLFIYEYHPEQTQKKKDAKFSGLNNTGWCIIELEKKHLFLLPGLNRDWNRLFQKMKKKNEAKKGARKISSSDEAIIKNAASMAFSK